MLGNSNIAKEKKKMKVACVVLASGRSKRFGQDKLTFKLDNCTIGEKTLDAIPKELFDPVLVVTPYAEVSEAALARGFTPVPNSDDTDDVSVTIKCGLEMLPEDIAGCMFCVCDQPYLTRESVRRLLRRFTVEPQRITALATNGVRGNPVIFPAAMLEELKALEAHQSGKAVIEKYLHLVTMVEAGNEHELIDIDRPKDIL